MNSSRNTDGSYVYFGQENGLTKEYTEDIFLLFNTDGLPLYHNSSQQFWPIFGLLLYSDYESQPFVIAVFAGDSKLANIDDYLQEFVNDTSSVCLPPSIIHI